MPFFSFGIDDIIVKHFVEKPDERLKTIKTANYLRLCSSLFGFFLVNICFYFIGKDFSDNYVPFFVFSLAYIVKTFETYKLIFTAETKEGSLVFGRSLIFISLALAKAYFAYTFHEWKIIVFISALELPLFTLYGFIKYKKTYKLKESNEPVERDAVYRLYKLGIGLFIVQFLGLAFNKVDQLMIPKLLSYSELGYYSVVAKLIELWTFIPGIIIVSLYPKIISLKGMKRRQEIRKMYSLIVWFGIFLTLGVYLVKRPLIEILYGARYLEAINIITLYAASIVFNFFNIARIKYIILEKIEKIAVFYGVFSLTLNIALNYIFIKRYGVSGAIYATIISDVCANVVFSALSKPMRNSCIDLFWALTLPIQMIIKRLG